jgi:sugar phosphate isomerase/epimerase
MAALAPSHRRAQPRRGLASLPVGMETWTFHDVALDAMLKQVHDLGVDHLELHDGHLPRTATPEQMTHARIALRNAGITATGVYIHDAFTDSEAVARPIFEYARRMGYRYINGGPKRESLPVLNKLVPEYGVKITIHNHGPHERYETLEHVTSALDAFPNLSSCIDIGHFARAGVDPVAATRALGGRAEAIHIKDVDKQGENAILGEGTIDLPGVFNALKESRFAGLLVLEYEGDFDNMAKRLAGIRASLEVLKRLIRGGV